MAFHGHIPSDATKHERWEHAKQYQIDSLLENLRGYRMVAGTIDMAEIRGEVDPTADDGELYGRAMEKPTESVMKPKSRREKQRDRRRRTRKHKVDPYRRGFLDDLDDDTVQEGLQELDEEKERREREEALYKAAAAKVRVDDSSAVAPASALGVDLYGGGVPLPAPKRASVGEDSDDGESSDEEVVQTSAAQRFAVPGEPVCTMCGKYGAYVCDETEQDVCSVECKGKHLADVKAEADERAERERALRKDVVMTLPENNEEKWDDATRKWKARHSSLQTQKCWKCKKMGHLPEDCTAFLGVAAESAAGELTTSTNESPGARGQVYSKRLRKLYNRGKRLTKDPAAGCSVCSQSANLAYCLDCEVWLCDGAGHLQQHLRDNPRHTTLYSRKLRRVLKCCKPTCPVTDVRKLVWCPHCVGDAFERDYSLINATWRGRGLKKIINSLCCEDHFAWHRINCIGIAGNVVQPLVCDESLASEDGLLSEFFF